MLTLFDSIVFGGLVGALVDYWLGRFAVKDNPRIVIAVLVGAIVGVLVGVGKVAYF